MNPFSGLHVMKAWLNLELQTWARRQRNEDAEAACQADGDRLWLLYGPWRLLDDTREYWWGYAVELVYSIAVGGLGGIQVHSDAGCRSVATCLLVVHVAYAAVYVRTLYHSALAMRCGTLVVAGLQVVSAVATVFSGLTATLATVLVWSTRAQHTLLRVTTRRQREGCPVSCCRDGRWRRGYW
jgi:hypothetical protein